MAIGNGDETSTAVGKFSAVCCVTFAASRRSRYRCWRAAWLARPAAVRWYRSPLAPTDARRASAAHTRSQYVFPSSQKRHRKKSCQQLRQMMKRSDSTALAATAKNWTPTASRARNDLVDPGSGCTT
jgi:hypothetical protein